MLNSSRRPPPADRPAGPLLRARHRTALRGRGDGPGPVDAVFAAGGEPVMVHPYAPGAASTSMRPGSGSGLPTACYCPAAVTSRPDGRVSGRIRRSTAWTRNRMHSTWPWPRSPSLIGCRCWRSAAAPSLSTSRSEAIWCRTWTTRAVTTRTGSMIWRWSRLALGRDRRAQDDDLLLPPSVHRQTGCRPDTGRVLRRRGDRGGHAGRSRRLVSRRPVASGGLGRHGSRAGRDLPAFHRRRRRSASDRPAQRCAEPFAATASSRAAVRSDPSRRRLLRRRAWSRDR